MQLIQTLILPPGCCFICKAAIRDCYIDTGVSLDYDGAFYICDVCINEAAHILSFISHDEYKDLRKSKEELEHLNYELIKRVGALEDSLSALANAGYKYNDDGNVARIGGYIAGVDKIPEDRAPGTKGDVGIRKGEVTESADDEGMAELYSSESSESEFVLDI